jgi:methyl-accepting chemotaxis protein
MKPPGFSKRPGGETIQGFTILASHNPWGTIMKIQMKLSVFIGSLLLLLVVLTVMIGTWVINTIIYGLNTELLSLKLAARLEKIEATVKLLEDSGVTGIAEYVQQTQQETLQQFQAEFASQTEGYYVIAAKTQQILFQSPSIQGKAGAEQLFRPEIIQEMVSQISGTRTYNHAGIGYFTVYRYFEQWEWLIGASLPTTTMFRQRQTYLVIVGWTSLVVFAGLLALSYVMVRSIIVNPVVALVHVANAIAAGKFDQTIQVRQRDEIGMLVRAFQTMQTTIQRVLVDLQGLIQAIQEGKLATRGNIAGYTGNWRDLLVGVNMLIDAFVAPVNSTAQGIDQIASGHLPEPLPETYQGEFNTITTKLNVMSSKLKDVVLHVKTAADLVAASSGKVHHAAEAMVQGVEEQAAAAEEASSSMEQMAANSRQNAENAMQTDKIAQQSAEYAEEGARVVAETIVAMQQIARKITIIQEIASQTRLLSLNATIEAARAQEQGKAFSVVAAEVRALSDTTRAAAEEIDELAASSQAISERAGEMLGKLVPNIRKTAQLVQEISAASREQNSGTEQVNKAILQLDQVTQSNSMTSEELAAMAEELATQATQLQRTIAFFKVQDGFACAAVEESRFSLDMPGSGIREDPAVRGKTRDYIASKKKLSAARLDAHGDTKSKNALGDETDAEFERY